MNIRDLTKRAGHTPALLLAACGLFVGGLQSAAAADDLTVDNGFLSGAAIKGSMVYRNFNSSGGKEVYVDNANFTPNSWSGANNDIAYSQTGGTGARTITFEYDGTTKTLKSVYSRSGASTVTTSETYTTDLGDLNYLAFQVLNSAGGPTPPYVTLTDITVSKNGADFTPTFNLGSASTLSQKHAIGQNLTGGFKVRATLNINGSPGGGDSIYVMMKVGYVEPADEEAPIVYNVHTTPAIPLINGAADVEATVDDEDTGDSDIVDAEYQLNGGAWTGMDASDGTFDSAKEDVEATIDPLTKIGTNTVCVIGEDSAGNVSGTTPYPDVGHYPCLDFIVAYNFDGFYSPVDMNVLNLAKAGQAIPFKWRLTDADGMPIEDPASFVALRSYDSNCSDPGTPGTSDAIEEYAGNSGLQYNGDGYWQFNWKTPKTYADQCKSAYVEFNSTQTSPVVMFKFKK